MADRVVVPQAGHIEQVGSPRMNPVAGKDAAAPGATTIGVRPEQLDISGQTGLWLGKVAVAERPGSGRFLQVTVAGIGRMTVQAGGDVRAGGDKVCLTPDGQQDRPLWHQWKGNDMRLLGKTALITGAAVPFGRLGTAADLIGMAVFLATPEADYIVAQTFGVDGGNWLA